MVDPKIGETICDPACGTGGFLIAAYDHILLANTSPEFIHETIGPYGLPVKRGIGDKLSRRQWEFLQKGAIHGFESNADILRMAAMNAVLHQFDHSPLIHRDSICGSEDKWDEALFDVILENPPFSGDRSDAKRSLRVEKGDKYVLFLAHALRSLRPGGRRLLLKESPQIRPSVQKRQEKGITVGAYAIRPYRMNYKPSWKGTKMERYELPEGWEWKRLGDVRKGYTYFAEGDVIFAKITPCMENSKSAIGHGLLNGIGFGSTEFHVLRPQSLVIPEWLHMLLRSKIVRDEAKVSICGAAGHQRVPIDFLENLEIPVPPLPEQRRIVKRIEELTRRVEETRKLIKEAESELASFTPALLAKGFRGEL
jgi:hypothetical protein